MTMNPEPRPANDHDDPSSPAGAPGAGVSTPEPAEGADDAPGGDEGSPEG